MTLCRVCENEGHFLSVNGFRSHSHGSLLECLRQSRVSVRCPGNVLRAGTVFDSQDSFRDHFSSVRSYDETRVRILQAVHGYSRTHR